MTIDELNNLYWLPCEISLIDKELRALKRATQAQAVSPEYKAGVNDLSALLLIRRNNCTRQYTELRAFIDSLPESMIKQVYIMRFEQGQTWEQIESAAPGMGYYYAPGTIKKICYRFLERV